MFEQCLYFNATSLARKLEREWTVAFKPFSLTAPQAFMLRVILQKPASLQSELAKEMNISREDQDFFAFMSQIKAKKAQNNGFLAEEIFPITIPQPKNVCFVISV